MNKGWKIANPNSFIYYLNARDLFATDSSLARASAALGESVSIMWGCSTHEEINLDKTGWVCKLVSLPSVSNQLYAYGYRSHQAVVMRKELISKLGGFNESYKIASDWDLIARALKDSKPAIWLHPLGRFELGGISSKKILQAHIELKEIRRKYLVFTFKHKVLDEIWCGIHLHNMGYRNIFTKIFFTTVTKKKRVTIDRFLSQTNKKILRILLVLGFKPVLKFYQHQDGYHFRTIKFKQTLTNRIVTSLTRYVHRQFRVNPISFPQDSIS
jgi:hypothetical protein